LDSRQLKARWQDWRAVDVDADELEDYRDELAERGLDGSTINHAAPRASCRPSTSETRSRSES
jgi:hypothetical protein